MLNGKLPRNKADRSQTALSIGKIENLSSGFLVIGALTFLIAIFNFSGSKAGSSTIIKTGLTERDIALQAAQKNNQKSYSFTTGFTPGLGYINPNTYANEQVTKYNQTQAKISSTPAQK
jgi:hypothetical protein